MAGKHSKSSMGLVGTCVCHFSKHVNKRHLKYVIKNIVSVHDGLFHLFNDPEIFFSKVLNKNNFKTVE